MNISQTYVVSVAVYAATFLLFLLIILFLLLVLLWDDIIQETEVMLREQVIHPLSDSDQSEDLILRSFVDRKTSALILSIFLF